MCPRVLCTKQVGKVQIIDDYEHRATLVFQGCKDCDYTLSEICTKVFIQDCENLTLKINGTVMTATVEAYKSKNIKVFVNKKIQTMQLDLCEDVHVTYASKDVFNFVVWAGSRLTVAVGEDTHSTSFDEMAQKDKTLVFERSQFKTWCVGITKCSAWVFVDCFNMWCTFVHVNEHMYILCFLSAVKLRHGA